MQLLGIIPARYGSTRFPGKPLIMIRGKAMIMRTWEQASKALDNVVVATDDERILNAVEAFGGLAMMTSTAHKSGTDRCAEAAAEITAFTGITYDVVINIQGDEPFIQPGQIKLLAGSFEDKKIQIATLSKRIESGNDIFSPDIPKVISDKDGFAIYFSRSPVPYIREKPENEWLESYPYFRHIGMYAYRYDVLQEITRLEPSSLETAESLEQNRWLENRYRIKVIETTDETIAIDTPDDLKRIK
jgi:3-deoxy-manno-octulosonate cytidylyltransferase (CMP-KDO synthetase)